MRTMLCCGLEMPRPTRAHTTCNQPRFVVVVAIAVWCITQHKIESRDTDAASVVMGS